MISRRTFFGAGAAAALTGCVTGSRDGEGAAATPKSFSLGQKLNLSLPRADVKEPVRVFVIGDTHWGFHDARDDAYAANYKRMAQWPAPADALPKALKRAKDAKADLVVLVGDNISFPTQANIDHLKQALSESGVDWMYVAGNHDWHFEGLPGSDIAPR